jgi:hypothetical protein
MADQPKKPASPTLRDLMKGGKIPGMEQYNARMQEITAQLTKSVPKFSSPALTRMLADQQRSADDARRFVEEVAESQRAAAEAAQARREAEDQWRTGLLEQQAETVKAINKLAEGQSAMEQATTWILRLTAIVAVVAVLALIVALV